MEIERKFKVLNEEFKKLAEPIYIAQGYLNSDKNRTVRIRITNNKAYLTIKSITSGISRLEFEYEIPLEDGQEILKNISEKPIIEKNRFHINFNDKIWEIDEFLGDNLGLIIAEIELNSEEEIFTKPIWVGEEVSHNPKYFNSSLLKNPFKDWKMI